jgi:hypothetical protein
MHTKIIKSIQNRVPAREKKKERISRCINHERRAIRVSNLRADFGGAAPREVIKFSGLGMQIGETMKLAAK